MGKTGRIIVEKIIASWKEHITEEDTVLLPGDLSWGMRIDEAAADLDVIYSLAGEKNSAWRQP